MSLRLYRILIRIYGAILWTAASFNIKARKLKSGRGGLFANLESLLLRDERYVWFHCASLGEFEQGRPVLEYFRQKHPEIKILLTFYSPSGYEVRKNYKQADIVSYLPLDTLSNVNRFLDLVKPELAIFVKYEFWPNFLIGLNKRGIPTISISAIFRQNQVYFWDFGQFFKNVLRSINHYFVQDIQSKQLLESIGITNVTIAGDTRFDRVWELASQPVKFEEIKQFIGDQQCFIAGSTWKADEELIIDYFMERDEWKVILVPHEIKPELISAIMDRCKETAILHSTMDANPPSNAKFLIIDTVGKLNKIYKYADIAYVGGGFGKGIHNILEPAVWGKPVIIGPQYQKFKEAKGLVDLKTAFPLMKKEDFPKIIKSLSDPEKRKALGEISRKYVEDNTGATALIVEELDKMMEAYSAQKTE
jgi:3-deoxy-D-manno-octulosonic-acid transferase